MSAVWAVGQKVILVKNIQSNLSFAYSGIDGQIPMMGVSLKTGTLGVIEKIFETAQTTSDYRRAMAAALQNGANPPDARPGIDIRSVYMLHVDIVGYPFMVYMPADCFVHI